VPYRFSKSDSSVEAGLRRIACEQIDKALASLEATGDARPKAVHDVRKRCKKVRGLLRLVRPSFSRYAQENAAFREAAGLLSGARDAKVLQDTFDAVTADAQDRSALASVRDALVQGKRAFQADGDLDAQFGQARGILLAARERAQNWSLADEGWGALDAGVSKTHRRARKAMRKAARKPDGERHHEWRKWVKYHLYHARLLRCIWPEQMKHRAREANELAELLGDHHDCHVLEQTIRADPDTFGSGDAARTVITLASRRGALLEEQAHRLGARLLADRPDALVGRWGEWWQTWRSEGDLQEAALKR
jgi:CHAD domain-containing protein